MLTTLRRPFPRFAIALVVAAAALVGLPTPASAELPQQLGTGWDAFDRLIGPGDFNGDFCEDLLAITGGGDLFAIGGDCAGGFTSSSAVKIGNGWQGFIDVLGPSTTRFSPGFGPFWDGDLCEDLLGITADGGLFLAAGNCAGGFLTSSAVQIGSGWTSFDEILGPKDFSADGCEDLLGRQPDGDLFLLEGDCNGGFLGAAKQIGNGWDGFDRLLGPAYWDGDTCVDLLAIAPNGDLFMAPGNCGGFASDAVKIGNGWQGLDLILDPGLWDGDLCEDIIATTPSGTLLLYPGDCNGQFIP